MSADRNKRVKARRRLMVAANMGISCAVAILLFGWLGYMIDRKRGNGFAFMIGGLFLGLAYCGYELWKLVRALTTEPDED